MSKETYLNKFKELPETVRELTGLVIITLIIILSFAILNNMFGEGDELVKKMKLEEERIPQRAILGANFLNFRAHEIYTINGNKIDETFVKWDQEKNKCFAGFTVSGDNVGVNESITVSGEALSFLSTGIDTRIYFIKNF